MRNGLKIGELARRTQCGIATIRYYEQSGLLPKPVRSPGNYRLYGHRDIERISFIRHCRSLDMTLAEIRTLLRFRNAPEENCGDVNALLDEHVGHVAERIAELTRLENQLKSLRRLCGEARAAKHCGILKKLSHATPPVPGRTKTGHVSGAHARGGRSSRARGDN